MRKFGRVIIAILLMIVSLTFFACEIPSQPDLLCNGTVTFNNVGLSDVQIKSSIKEYTITNDNGSFSFSTKAKTITIYPEKSGYIFSPKQITLISGENTANFTATKIEELSGKLRLNSVIITPTSILSTLENFAFFHNGKTCLKAYDIKVKGAGITKSLNTEDVYLNKGEQNIIYNSSNIVFNCGESASIGILINTYFVSYHQTNQTSEDEFTYLYINKPQTNQMLQDGQIIYNLYGINNRTKSFTYDISFVFDYINI